MTKVNNITDKLRVDLKTKIRKQINDDKNAYKELLKNLMIQVSNYFSNNHRNFVGAHQTHGVANFH